MKITTRAFFMMPGLEHAKVIREITVENKEGFIIVADAESVDRATMLCDGAQLRFVLADGSHYSATNNELEAPALPVFVVLGGSREEVKTFKD